MLRPYADLPSGFGGPGPDAEQALGAPRGYPRFQFTGRVQAFRGSGPLDWLQLVDLIGRKILWRFVTGDQWIAQIGGWSVQVHDFMVVHADRLRGFAGMTGLGDPSLALRPQPVVPGAVS